MQLSNFFDEFGKPKGVIHVSPSLFSARNYYLIYNLNIIWVEGNPFFYQKGLNLLQNSNEKLFNYYIGPNNVGINLSIDNGENVFHEIQSSNIKDLLETDNIKSNDYDYIYIGKQVYKLDLDCFNLEYFKYVIIETTTNVKNHLGYDSEIVKKYMKKKRFKLVYSNIFENNVAHLFFVKKRDYKKKLIK